MLSKKQLSCRKVKKIISNYSPRIKSICLVLSFSLMYYYHNNNKIIYLVRSRALKIIEPDPHDHQTM